jgi:Ca-activated chloride channel homolog
MFMPKQATMHLRNDTLSSFFASYFTKSWMGAALAALILLFAGLSTGALSAQEVPAQPPASSQPSQDNDRPVIPGQNDVPVQPPASQPRQDHPVQPGNQPSNSQTAPQQQQQGQELEREAGGGFRITKTVDEVQLHATVMDDKHHLVTNLAKGDFAIYENGRPQQIKLFDRRDIPVSIGIVIDNSGSMRDKRPAVNQAALNLVRASNPEDEVFIVNFNDEYYLDQDFTSNLKKLQEGLEKIDSRGGTALYDAIVASADHLEKNAKLDKRVILVVTDGEDNASRESLEQAIRRLDVDNGPTVYTIGLLGDEHQKRARRALQALADRTGGIAFFPKDLREVDSITREVAHDIRNQYILVYKPDVPRGEGGYRTVKVEAKAPGHGKLFVRTRTGYYAGSERASNEGGK